MDNSFRKKLLKTLCLFLLSATSYASFTCDKTGAITECGEGKLDNLQVTGIATLVKTTVIGNTHIAGTLNAKWVNLDTLDVAGKATIFSSKISGPTKISGLLISCQNNFSEKLEIFSDKTYIENSQTGEIKINKGGDTQVLYLGGTSIVHGNITFPDNHGLVVMDKNAKITGRVIGGDIEQNNFQSHCTGEAYEKD